MKTLSTMILLASMILISSPTQAGEKGRQPQLLFVEEIVVKPGKIQEYAKVLQDLYAGMKKMNYQHPFFGFLAEDAHYYFLCPVDNFASMDELYASFGKMAETMGKKWASIHKRLEGVIEYEKFFMIRHRPDLSYMPAKPGLKEEEEVFYSVDFTYLQYGKQAKFEAACKEMVALLTKHKYNRRVEIYMGDLGTDHPMYIVAVPGKSLEDIGKQLEIFEKKMGKQIKAINQKLLSTTRRIDTKYMQSPPALSYIPAGQK